MTNTKSFSMFKSSAKPSVLANLPKGEYDAILYSLTKCEGRKDEDGVQQPDYFAFSLKVVGLTEDECKGYKLHYPRSIYENFHSQLGAILLSYVPELENADTKTLVRYVADNGVAIKVELEDPNELDDKGLPKPSQVALLFKNSKNGGL